MNYITFLSILFLTSCAGPMNPFGSQVWINSEFKQIELEKKIVKDATIKTYPNAQIYHAPYDLIIQIADEKGVPRDFRYQVLYNGEAINNWWKTENIIFDSQNPNIVSIIFKNLSLLAERENQIEILYYRTSASIPITYKINPPKCSLEKTLRIGSIEPFHNISPVDILTLESISQTNQINPPLLAALIAQESSFNTNAVSWAKAIGLTQVTPIANEEIIGERETWPVDQRIQDMNYLQVKARILTGKINKYTDWRLDKHKSLEGGILYIKRLKRYWSKSSNIKLLNETFNRNIPWTDIILASYNSGAYRVKKSIKRHNKDWIQDHSLEEAKKYVRNIKSYCFSFSDFERSKTLTSPNKIVQK